MNYRYVCRVVGLFLLAYSPTMLIPLAVGYCVGEPFGVEPFDTVWGFCAAASVTIAMAFVLLGASLGSKTEFFHKEGILSVAAVWYLVVVCSALPFVFTGTADFASATFESASGLTTTGASVFGAKGLPAIEDLPASLLFWRAQLHWIGGLGIIVMFLVLLPMTGATQKRLFFGEVPGISKDTLRPRMTRTVALLFRIYLLLTIAITTGFLVFGMNLFEAVCHAFATIATGGFSTRNLSIGAFHSLGIEMVCLIGMLMSGTSFALYFSAFEVLTRRDEHGTEAQLTVWGKVRRAIHVFWTDREFRLYVTIWMVVTSLITITLVIHGPGIPEPPGEVHDYTNVGEALRSASFSVGSLSTSTGFGTRDYLGWPFLAHALLILIMLHGGCTGSTSGGLKVARFLVVLKLVSRGFRRFLRPRRVEKPLQLGDDNYLDAEGLEEIVTFSAVWFITWLLGGLAILFLSEVDVLTAFSSVLSCMGNIGPGVTEVLPHTLTPLNDAGVNVGPYGSYGAFTGAPKLLFAFIMVAGRLEIYAAIAVFAPSFWKD